jgi:hypothetical protein
MHALSCLPDSLLCSTGGSLKRHYKREARPGLRLAIVTRLLFKNDLLVALIAGSCDNCSYSSAYTDET